MKKEQVTEIVNRIFSEYNNFSVRFIEGCCDTGPDYFLVTSRAEVYKEGYEFEAKIVQCGEEWVVSLNGFMKQEIDNTGALEHVLRQFWKYQRSPCAEEELASINGGDQLYY